MKTVIFSCAFAVNICLIHSVHAQEKLYPNEFNLSDVKLLDGPFKHARELNIQTLLKYNVDRLLAPYLKEAGLKPKDSSYKNWAGLDGHIAGHYLTAMAINTATGRTNYPLLWDRELKPKPALKAVLNVPAMMKN